MGAGVSTEGAPLSEVAIKNEIGVLYDANAKQAFDAAATEGPDGTRTVPWPTIEAHAKQHDERALDPRKCLFQNLKGFKAAREQIAEIASKHIKGAVEKIPWVGMDLGDECQQCGLDGTPAKTLEDLYAIAEVAREEYAKVMTAACADSTAALTVAGLKGKERAAAKASEEYKDKTAPFVSWLFDVVRGSVLCETEDAIVHLFRGVEADRNIEIVRVKNRFNPPLFNGYRDILMNVAVKVGSVSHLCELQIHLKAIKDSEPMHKSHLTYEFFRAFFLGNADAVEERLNLLMALPVDEANDVVELVDRVLGSDADANLLEGLCELLASISEFAGVVKVREAILAEKERASGAESKAVGVALYDLGEAYWRLGENAKQRDACERALPIYEREYGSDSTEVAGVLNDLGNAYGDLGDYAKKRDMLERALAIDERVYGRDHAQVGIKLVSLGRACSELGDQAKARDLQERALAIQERAYGREHSEVAITLGNLANVHIALGDAREACKLQQRALAIKEREYGHDHPQVAFTLRSLGIAHRDLGDAPKSIELLERSLAIFERHFGPENIAVAKARWGLGETYAILGDVATARSHLERAVDIFEAKIGHAHRGTRLCRETLASLSEARAGRPAASSPASSGWGSRSRARRGGQPILPSQPPPARRGMSLRVCPTPWRNFLT